MFRLLHVTHDHNHEADERKINVRKTQQQIRTAVENIHDRLAKIRLNTLADMPARSREVYLGSITGACKPIELWCVYCELRKYL